MKSMLPFSMTLLMATAATFQAHSYTVGDYQTISSGNWSQVSIWQYYNGSAWVAASVAPSYTDNDIYIRNYTTVTVTTGITADQITVNGSGALIVNSGVTLTINDGTGTDLSVSGTVTVNGTLVNKGTISSSASEMTFTSGALYQHNHDGGGVPGATWNDGSTCEINGITSSSSLNILSNQSFYHFKWNCPSQTAETNVAGDLETIRGNFTMVSTGPSGKFKLAESADYTLTISGNWDHQGGTLNMGGGTSFGYINLAGNFSISGGKITETNSTGYYTKITFNKAETQTYIKTGGTFENNIDFDITGGTTLDVGDYIVDGSAGQFSVNSGSTLKTSNPNGITNSGASGSIQTTSRYYSFAANYQYYRAGAQSTGNGLPSSLNGKLIIGSTSSATNLAITNVTQTINGTLILCSSASANSTIASGTIAYGASGTLEYQGASAQTTAAAEWPAGSSPVNVTINNSSGANLAFGRTISGALTLTTGTFSIGAHTLTLNGSLVKTGGNLSGGSTSTIIIGGTSVTALDLPDVILGDLTLNRASSGVRLIGNVTIYGTMTMTSGAVTLSPSKALSYVAGSRLKYNGTVNQTTAAEEFPATAGPPLLVVDKSGATTLNLNFSRTLSEDLVLTAGALSIGANTLTLNGLIIRTAGTLTGGSSSNIIFGGTGAATSLPAVTLNNLTISRPAGINLGGNVTVSGTLYLTLGALGIQSNTLTINGTINQTSGSLSGILSSTLIFGPSASPAILPAVYIGYLEINRSSGVSMNGDSEVAAGLTLTSGSLSIMSNTLALSGSMTLAGGSLAGGTTSNLVIGGTGSAITLPSLSLGTLTASRAAGVILGSGLAVETSLVLNTGDCNLNGNLLSINGSIQYNGGTLTGSNASSMQAGGSGATLNLAPITLGMLIINRTNGLNLTGNILVENLLVLQRGTVSRNGYTLYGPSASLRYQGTTAQTTSDGELPETGGPLNLEIMNPAGVILHAGRSIPGNLVLQLGTFTLSNQTLTINGVIQQASGTLNGGGTGSLIFSPGTAPSDLPAVNLFNLVIDRNAGVTTTGDCMIMGTLTLNHGDFTVGLSRTLRFMGFPIEGSPENLKTTLQSNLEFGGTQPGFIIPSGVVQAAAIVINNTAGVTLGTSPEIFSGVMVKGYFIMKDYIISGPGSFSLNMGGKIAVGHPDGVAGNIQVAGPVLLDSKSDWVFDGSTSQLTNFLPTTIPSTIRNLTIANSEPNTVTLNTDMTLTGGLTIKPGATFVIHPDYHLTVQNDVEIQ